MTADFLLYGANGFVGQEIARLAVNDGLRPLLAGRNQEHVSALAAELGLEYRIFGLDDSAALDDALNEVPVVLHCAGPYLYTFEPMMQACLRTSTHYLDITGELPVYVGLAEQDEAAKAQGVMLLPGVGFDVVPTDCLALHLKQRLPSATHLTLAFHSRGPAGLPPGTTNTMFEMVPLGNMIRHDGKLITVKRNRMRKIDFGAGPKEAIRFTWGDIFTAYYSTGIPNIENYIKASRQLLRQMDGLRTLRPLFNMTIVRELFKRITPSGSTAEERAETQTHVWGEVEDDEGQTATARLHGPEAGVIWTKLTALAAVREVLAGNAPVGFQTPARAFGADFVLQHEGVRREDLD